LSKKSFVYTGRENLEAMAEAKNYNKFLINFIKRSKKQSDLKVLDFGAGSGTYADMLKEEGIIVDCLEPDAVQQEELTRKSYKVLSDAKALKPSSYDIIYALNVLEHIEDDEGIVVTLTNALKKGGRLIIYVPAFQVLFTSMDEKVGHHRRYRKDRLASHAKKASLNVSELYYCDPLGFCAAFVFKYIGSKDGVISSRSVKIYDTFIFPVSRLLQPVLKKFIGKNVVLIAQK
jgi:SAM-dependent methyltransferase